MKTKAEAKAYPGGGKSKTTPSTSEDRAAPQPASRTSKASQQNGSLGQSSNAASSGHASPRDTATPAEGRGFNNPQPARREANEARTNNRQTRMVGAEDMNGEKEELDERPFRQEKVSRVPTKALLKPPKNPNSMIADPDDDDYDLY